jgi:large subunit ribosomal protein L21e
MSRTKRIQSKGKPGLNRIFREFSKGDSVAVVREPSIGASFPFRIQGLTGKVVDQRGKSYVVEIKTMDKAKKFIIEPVHLKRIKTA